MSGLSSERREQVIAGAKGHSDGYAEVFTDNVVIAYETLSVAKLGNEDCGRLISLIRVYVEVVAPE